jgi:hypothetical protein
MRTASVHEPSRRRARADLHDRGDLVREALKNDPDLGQLDWDLRTSWAIRWRRGSNVPRCFTGTGGYEDDEGCT